MTGREQLRKDTFVCATVTHRLSDLLECTKITPGGFEKSLLLPEYTAMNFMQIGYPIKQIYIICQSQLAGMGVVAEEEVAILSVKPQCGSYSGLFRTVGQRAAARIPGTQTWHTIPFCKYCFCRIIWGVGTQDLLSLRTQLPLVEGEDTRQTAIERHDLILGSPPEQVHSRSRHHP